MDRHSRRRSTGQALLVVSLLTAGLALVPSAYADTVTASSARVERPVTTSSPVTGVAESEVQLMIPLPATAGAHPAACDWLT